MSNLLLVEDDPAVLEQLQAIAQAAGLASLSAQSAAQARRCIEAQPFDAVLLELSLPDSAGLRLIEEIREISVVPLIVVSRLSDEAVKVAALEAGADDYVTKPFLSRELLARIRAVLRRYTLAGEARRKSQIASPVKVRGLRSIKEGGMEDRLVKFLRSSGPGLVRSTEIIHAVWGGDKQRSEKNLRVLVTMVRRRLEAQGSPFDIINVHGRGYRLVRKKDLMGVHRPSRPQEKVQRPTSQPPAQIRTTAAGGLSEPTKRAKPMSSSEPSDALVSPAAAM